MGHNSKLDMGSAKAGTGIRDQGACVFCKDLVSITPCLFACP